MNEAEGGFSVAYALRAAVGMALVIALLAVPLGLLLPHSFFETWGWIVGPAAWMLAAIAVASVLHLPLGWTLAGAALAGAVSGVFVALGLHWPAIAAAIVAFAAWCGSIATRRAREARPAAR